MRMIFTSVIAAAMIAVPATAAEDPRVAAEVMALARAQWASEIAGQSVSEQMSSVADDYTEFNADYPTRIDGKAMNLALSNASAGGGKSLAGDMSNARVQVYGDTAILTYNFAGVLQAKDGKISPNTAKSTRVYARSGGKWMLVHANFAPISGPTN
jgi:ketosteroid isomerase-like protein